MEFLKRLDFFLAKMLKEAALRKAPVLYAESVTKNNPFKILVFTMLSARTRDSTTISVVEKLFAVADTPEKISMLDLTKLEKLLYGVGFYRTKARNLIAACTILTKMKKIPNTLDEMLELPGVGRKTANIVLARAYGKNTLGVDTHVHRLSNRLGLVKTKTPEKTEKALVKIIPEKFLGKLNRAFVGFGQTVCTPLRPKCPICPLNKICPRIGVKLSELQMH